MRLGKFASIALLAWGFALPSFAQVNEIIVTGNRMSSLFIDDDEVPPNVTLPQRADFLVQWVRVECDTRDVAQRNSEIRASLQNMLKNAMRDPMIILATGDVVVKDFTADMIGDSFPSGRRPQTSSTSILIKTPLAQADLSREDAEKIIDEFVDGVITVGRTEVLQIDAPSLSLVNPEGYRSAILKLIAADAQATAIKFGPDYRVRLQNMAKRVDWTQTETLTMELYIPYKLEVFAVK